MRSHSVTCHPAEVTFPPLPQPKLVLDLATAEGCKAELTWDDRGPISLAGPGPPSTLRRLWPEQSRLGSHPTSACDFLPRPSLTFLTAKHHCCFGNFWPIPNYTTNWWQMCMHVNSHFMKVQWPEAVTDGQITIAIGIYIVIW